MKILRGMKRGLGKRPRTQREIVLCLCTISMVLTLFILLLGGSLNPLLWDEQFGRRRTPTQLIDPFSSPIQTINSEFEEEYGELLGGEDSLDLDPHVCEISEMYIRSLIEYKGDITNYLCIDHLATTEEVIQRGKDDCDGQAVLIASLLIHRGYDARVVLGYAHVWVEVTIDDTTISINNPKGYTFRYCTFNDREVQWNTFSFFILIMGFFLLFFSLSTTAYYVHRASLLRYFSDYVYVFKYVFFLFVLFFGFGTVILLIIKIFIS